MFWRCQETLAILIFEDIGSFHIAESSKSTMSYFYFSCVLVSTFYKSGYFYLSVNDIGLACKIHIFRKCLDAYCQHFGIFTFDTFQYCIQNIYNIYIRRLSLVVKELESQFVGPGFKTTKWLQGQLSLSSFQSRSIEHQELLQTEQ